MSNVSANSWYLQCNYSYARLESRRKYVVNTHIDALFSRTYPIPLPQGNSLEGPFQQRILLKTGNNSLIRLAYF